MNIIYDNTIKTKYTYIYVFESPLIWKDDGSAPKLIFFSPLIPLKSLRVCTQRQLDNLSLNTPAIDRALILWYVPTKTKANTRTILSDFVIHDFIYGQNIIDSDSTNSNF